MWCHRLLPKIKIFVRKQKCFSLHHQEYFSSLEVMCVLGPLSQLMKLYHCQRSSEKLYDYLVWACTRLERFDVRSLQSKFSKTINNCFVLANWYPFCMFLYHLFMPHWWLGSRLGFREEPHFFLSKNRTIS